MLHTANFSTKFKEEEKLPHKVGRTEKLAEKVGRREINPPVPPPSFPELSCLKFLAFN